MKHLALAVAFFLLAGRAQALPFIDFTDGGIAGAAAFSETIETGSLDGVTASFSNALTQTNATTFHSFSGLGLGIGSGLFPHDFDVVFSSDALWTGGTISQEFVDFSLGFSVTGQGVAQSGLFADPSIGSFSLTMPILFLAGETYSFSTAHRAGGTTGAGVITFYEWTFGTQTIPEPGSLSLILLGAAALGVARYRRAA